MINRDNSINRLAFVMISVVFQVLWILGLVMKLNEYYAQISIVTSLVAFVVVLFLYGKDGNMALKMPWIMLILVFPIWGVSFYFLCGKSYNGKRMQHRFEKLELEMKSFSAYKSDAMQEIRGQNPIVANQMCYLEKYAKAPVYKNQDVEFFSEASEAYNSQLEDLKRAQHFIFMEYFAIEDEAAFGPILEILEEKVKEGVEVRVLYDDVGSVGFVNPRFVRKMEGLGIQCRIFNPLFPLLNMFMNNRDHRKITVIDGRVAYTGGYNLAREYFNMRPLFGHWKDTGVRIEGAAVRSFTVMLLQMWNAMEHTDLSYERFFLDMAEADKVGENRGYVQPYGDNPLDGERVGENVYLNIIKGAARYVYFITPYLIITDEMRRELGLAAKRGIDVRIITPGIPDKKLIYRITRSYYGNLVKDGVRIFEYTPGFCHAKECICDDEVATIGTINLDYRSLYLHFENGVYMYQTDAVKDMAHDYQEMLKVSKEVTEQYRSNGKRYLSLGQSLLRIIAPLL